MTCPSLLSLNANVTDSFSYGPYGELNNHTGSSTTPFQYNGQFGVQTDPNGLLYMRARYYNPAIQRFISQDTLLGDLDPGISLNRFAYANGDPIDGIDPTGKVVYLASHAVALGANHLFLYIVPDSPNDFEGNPLLDGLATTVSATPQWHESRPGWGTVTTDANPNTDLNSPQTNSLIINPLPGQTDTQLIQLILAAQLNYQQNENGEIQYPGTGIPNPFVQEYNSAGYITGLLNSIGQDGVGLVSQLASDGDIGYVPHTWIGYPGADKPIPSSCFQSKCSN